MSQLKVLRDAGHTAASTVVKVRCAKCHRTLAHRANAHTLHIKQGDFEGWPSLPFPCKCPHCGEEQVIR